MFCRNLSQRSKSLQSEFDQWREKLKACNTATDSSYKESETRLRELLKSVDGEAKILGKVVASIEKNRDQFAHIDDAELRERSRFSKDIKDIVKKVKFELDSEQTNAKKRADVNKELNSVRIDAAERQRKSKLEAEKDAARDQRANELTQLQEKQDALIRDQDSILGSMSDALARLNNQAVIINEEIENQAM
jgi:chromosome segregation ATPase